MGHLGAVLEYAYLRQEAEQEQHRTPSSGGQLFGFLLKDHPNMRSHHDHHHELYSIASHLTHTIHSTPHCSHQKLSEHTENLDLGPGGPWKVVVT